MTSFQKVVKYLAIAFAVLLIVAIVGGIITGLGTISFFISEKEAGEAGEMQTYEIEGDISSLSISLSGAELKIQTADKFAVESNHKYISVKSDNGKLCISETKKPFASYPEGVTVVLSVPENFAFDDAVVETGAGKVEIDALSCNVLRLSLGAGKADIKSLTACSRAEIDGGAGELSIRGGKLCALRLDMGVGKLALKSRVEGGSEINCGIGKTDITLIGGKSDYKIEIDKGIGQALIEGEAVSGGTAYGTGDSRIAIDCGIGALDIRFAEE